MRRAAAALGIVALTAASACGAPPPDPLVGEKTSSAPRRVLVGLERLDEPGIVSTGASGRTVGGSAVEYLEGKRLGLVVHAASVAADGRHAIDVVRGHGLEVVRLFSPEHGLRGRAAAGLIDYFYPRLMYRNWDEPFGLYGYVAESVETPEDRSWITFRLNPDARFHDGSPITVDDVIFSMETLRDQATPRYRANYDLIDTVQRVGSHGVRFNLSADADREAPLRIALMPILSRADFADREFDETWLDPPLGGGPYRINRVDPPLTITSAGLRREL